MAKVWIADIAMLNIFTQLFYFVGLKWGKQLKFSDVEWSVGKRKSTSLINVYAMTVV